MSSHAPEQDVVVEDFPARARTTLSAEAPDLAGLGKGARPAAVLMPLLRVDGAWHFLFTVRPASMPDHAGEICFPGGRLKPGELPLDAALREAEEEVGITPACVSPIGFCAPRLTGSGHIIAPLLGMVKEQARIRPCPREVAEVFTAPLAHFLRPANYHRERMEVRGRLREYWVIPWRDRRIWGATAAILHDLAQRLLAHHLAGGGA